MVSSTTNTFHTSLWKKQLSRLEDVSWLGAPTLSRLTHLFGWGGGTEKSLRREWLDMLEATVWSGLWGPFLSKSRKLDGKVGTYRVQGGSRILQIKLKKYFPHFCCDDYFGLRLMKPRKKPVI